MRSAMEGVLHRRRRTSVANSPRFPATFKMLMLPESSPSTAAMGATMGEFPAVMWKSTPTGAQPSKCCLRMSTRLISNGSSVPSSAMSLAVSA